MLANADRDKRSNVSLSREAAIFASTMGVNIKQVKVSSASAVSGSRTATRALYAEEYMAAFKQELTEYPDVRLCVHWDGKILTNYTGNNNMLDKVDCLAIIITGLPTPWLIDVAKLDDGTGKAQADAICIKLEVLGILHRIFATCFDTTSTNTGAIKGTVARIEKNIGRILLNLYCAHHELDLIAGAICHKVFGNSTAPTDESNNDFKFFFPALKNDATFALDSIN